ncbi:MAG: hypothetical protein A2Y33_16435 [Spirochaetes bacterium GWF1_51_8]|nr:MAG: hypothetical protein A2Y33_16435 [Spirochaetes bacterium GWF1_51_8]
MKIARLVAGVFLLFPLLFISSCEEFFLQRTVSLLAVSGDIEFIPSQNLITGNIVYDIKNLRNTAIDEVYLISHPSVELKNVMHGGKSIGFDQGIGYGYGIYRIKIPPLGTFQETSVSLEFEVRGPILEDRFVLTKNYVFFDSKKIWLPLPFAEEPEFDYSLTIKTPMEYYPILGAKLVDESVNGAYRIGIWTSEVSQPILTGSLMIAPLNRYESGDIYIYSDNDLNIQKISDYSEFTLKTLREKVGGFPFSEMHIVNQLDQYKNMEMFIDGEYFANCIHVTPNLFSFPSLQKEQLVIYSAIPFLPKNNELKLFEILAHEISHSYFATMIRFEDNSHVLSESMTEFLGVMVMKTKYPVLFDKMMERNRFILQNLYMKNQIENPIWEFFCGVNILGFAFDDTGDKYFRFVEILYKKYQYTKIRLSELVATAKAMLYDPKGKNGSASINTEALGMLKQPGMYNLSLSYTNISPTNSSKFPKYLVSLRNTFPIAIDIALIVHTLTNSISNMVSIPKGMISNFIIDSKVTAVDIKSSCPHLEYCLYDNRIDLVKTALSVLNEQVNKFYQGKPYDAKLLVIGGEDPSEIQVEKQDVTWKNLNSDRKLSVSIHSNIVLKFDQVHEKENEMYIQAFKYINGKPFSYVVIKMLRVGKKFQAVAILDPSL